MERVLREATDEELATIGGLIDEITLLSPQLLHTSPHWCALVHAYAVERLARVNWAQLQRERGLRAV